MAKETYVFSFRVAWANGSSLERVEAPLGASATAWNKLVKMLSKRGDMWRVVSIERTN